jgi:hypothetical protein
MKDILITIFGTYEPVLNTDQTVEPTHPIAAVNTVVTFAINADIFFSFL